MLIEKADFTVKPDFGGTRYPMVKEIGPKEISFYDKGDGTIAKVRISDNDGCVYISLNEPNRREHLEATYDFTGQLKSAYIWLRRCADRPDFKTGTEPDAVFNKTYNNLLSSGTDLMFEADLSMQEAFVYHCKEDSRSNLIKGLSYAKSNFSEKMGIVINFVAVDSNIPPVKFFTRIDDAVLTIGFCINGKNQSVYDFISSTVNFGKLGLLATPGEVRRILDSVFLTV